MKRELKRATWKYNFETNKLELILHEYHKDSGETELLGSATLSRTYMFSLMRFMVSVAQKLRIEEGKKLREKARNIKKKYLERIGRLKISNKNLRQKNK